MDEFLAQLFPQAPSYFPGLLGQEQANLLQQQARQQGLLGLGMGLLQAAAPSTVRPSLAGGVAQGLAAGQQMAQNVYSRRLQEQQIAQQLAEQQRLLQEQEAARRLMPQILRPGETTPSFYGQPTTFPMRDDEGQLLPGAGTRAGQPQIDMGTLQALLTQAPSVAARVLPVIESFRKMSAPERVTLKKGETILEQTPFGLRPIAGGTEPEYREVGGVLYEMTPGQAPKVVVDTSGKLTGEYSNIAKGLFGTDVVSRLPQNAFEQIKQEILAQKREGRTVIDMTGGQKGFENERALRNDFQGSPEYKGFQEMRAAYTQVMDSLKQGTPIGDVAAATKIMKLLDPGSVVRESELAIAMQATGLLDRVTGYADSIKKGQKLTSSQKAEFGRLANDLFETAAKTFNDKRDYYSTLATEYGFEPNRVVGKPIELPGGAAITLKQQAEAELRRRRGQ